MPTVQKIVAREIFDSRGFPTVEADLWLDDGSFGRAAVPSGASTGIHEAVELRDGDARMGGKGVQRAVDAVNGLIAQELVGAEADQTHIDEQMIALDGTTQKSRFGANAILSISMALSKALAHSRKQPLYEYFRSLSTTVPSEWILPTPMINILNGGKHATGASDFQEFMIMPIGAQSFREAMEMAANVFHKLKKHLHDSGYPTTVGDEGGFAPSLGSNRAALEYIQTAIDMAGYRPGKDVAIGMDVAASEFFQKDTTYRLESEGRTLTEAELLALYESWVSEFPIISIEDGFDQDSWSGYAQMTERMGKTIQLVGDDLFVTNVERLQQGIDTHVANAILIKLNQIGTVTETVHAIDLARAHGYAAVVSHRSGETEDTTIADFVVGLSTGQIKTGSMSRTDRMAKYNQLLRIEEELGVQATYAGRTPFHRGSDV